MASWKPPTSAKEVLRRYAAGERAFAGANLRNADLRAADLNDADLREASMSHANLRGAYLERADLSSADFDGANIGGAHLERADLTGARLTGADLIGAHLGGANLIHANLEGANLEGANIGGTVLVDIDLSPFCEARSTIRSFAPSVVDHTSILRSIQAPGLKEFLAQIGMPEVFVEYVVSCALSLKTDVFKMLRSTFISYGSPDETFARELYEALHRNGVTTFFFPEHAVPGEKLHDVMRTKVNELDRIVLLCSKNSLDRKGVANEIEETLAREARDGGEAYLIPITIDDYVFSGWKPPKAGTAQAVRDRVVADFRGADTDPAKFQAALIKLIGALKK